MPPKQKISKDNIIEAALGLIRKNGISALNARALAAELKCSTQPIFSNYSSMRELQDDAMKAAYAQYTAFTKHEMESGEYPPYKASGMAYIRFAKDEPRLFSALFMRERNSDQPTHDGMIEDMILPIIMKNTGMSLDEARLFHLEMWVFVHGIASMFVTSFLTVPWELVSDMLSDAYLALGKYKEENKSK